jgi:predicted DNA-binding transcriptional regulator YafY
LVRASRLVALLLLLQHRGQVTAAELARELEVSVRTIYRDLEALSAAGVPVYAEAGRNGGARLVDGYRTRLTGLTAKEAEALFAAGVPGPVGELGLGTVLGAAQLKLLAALPKDLADRATIARQRFHYDAPGWFKASRNEPHLAALSAAVWDDRRVEVDYRHPGADASAKRVLDPLGLVNKAGIWYLVARRDDELRTYRVSRVQSVTALDAQFERDTAFDLAAYWETSVATYEAQVPPIEIVVRVSADAFSELQWFVAGYGRALKSTRALADGRRRCVLAFEHLDDAFFGLLRLGADVEVIEPETLRTRLAETARAMTALYT